MLQKRLVFSFIFFFSISFCYAQESSNLSITAEKNNNITEIRLNCSGKYHTNEDFYPYFVNGIFCPSYRIENSNLDINLIKNIKIDKTDTIFNGINFNGKILISYKGAIKEPKLITLQKLKEKYTNLHDTVAIYTINRRLLRAIDKQLIDEDDILSVDVSNLKSKQEGYRLKVINILLKPQL